jgi:signal transduction histidine kinase
MRERVEELGGTIEVSSRSGEGTVVTVRVPVEDGTPTLPRL